MATGTPPSGQAAGQYKTKIIAENEKLQVNETVYRPGEGAPMDMREGRVFYYLTGGTIERTFADGAKAVLTVKAEQATINTEKRPYSVKNIGKTTIHFISVHLK